MVGCPGSRARAEPRTSVSSCPDAVLGSITMLAVPMPRSLAARVVVPCTSVDVSTRTFGAPLSPSRLTSHPALDSTACRAAARHVTWAIWQPVTREYDADAGRPSTSLSQVPQTSSTTAAAGLQAYRPAFWSQVAVSQSAPSDAGSPEP